jgi:hypothetical protein
LRNDINVDNTLTAVDAASYICKKKLLAYGFTDKAMTSAERFIVQHVDRWCEFLIADEKREELTLEAGKLSNSGSRTTTSVMAAFFFNINRNQLIYNKLALEIRNPF